MGFAFGHIAWMVFAPGNFLLILLLLGVILSLIAPRRGRTLIVAAAAGFLAIAVTPLPSWLAQPLEDRFPPPALPDKIDGIIMLGGAVDPILSAVRHQTALNDAGERITETLVLARRYPDARILLSGGEGHLFKQGFSEATATRELLVKDGIAPDRILEEANSRSTWENAAFSRDLVRPQAGEKWLLVTSAMHMPRAVGCFRRVGWEVIPYPADYRTPRPQPERSLSLSDGLLLTTTAGKEWVGLLAYRLFGRTDALLPAPAPPID